MQFSECLPADGISAAAQNGNFGLSCGAALLPSYTNTLVAGRRPMSPNGTTRKALGGAATATAILGTRDVLIFSLLVCVGCLAPAVRWLLPQSLSPAPVEPSEV